MPRTWIRYAINLGAALLVVIALSIACDRLPVSIPGGGGTPTMAPYPSAATQPTAPAAPAATGYPSSAATGYPSSAEPVAPWGAWCLPQSVAIPKSVAVPFAYREVLTVPSSLLSGYYA